LEKTKGWSKALVVHDSLPASDVADIVDLNDVNLVLVVNQGADICGILAPATVIDQAREHFSLSFKPDTFSAAVLEIDKLTKPKKGGLDWLNTRRPDLHWCAPGYHLTSENPCSEHEK
jgi:hypothetical protein